MTIRRVTSREDHLWRSALEATLPEIVAGQGHARQDLKEALNDTRCYALVAANDPDERPIGILTAYRFPDLTASGDLVYLYDVVVVPGHRCQGVASSLIRTLIALCQSDGVARIWAGTANENLPAQRAFQGTGGRLIGETYTEYEWPLNEAGKI